MVTFLKAEPYGYDSWYSLTNLWSLYQLMGMIAGTV